MNRLFKALFLLIITAQTSAPAMAQEFKSGAPTYSMTQLLAFPLFLLALWLFIRIMKAKSQGQAPDTFSRAKNRAQVRSQRKHASGR